ncbi:AarF/ABC1/UbiB kinase family protein [uncultured Methanobrevibacter sp.]|uniref:ABC1 kinase family protein n=2 Tax=uncultured Methanobrevibacter sp. TaxID=253161 RepID=UPI0025E9ED40|nr:AarF/UbiB family protein [uncultured Methanobrevibacter sp.]
MVNREVNKRFHEITKALRKYGFGKFLNKTVKEKIIPSKDDEYEILLDTELPKNLRMMFQELGTSFIKLGQLLSTRPDMVGERIAKEFEQLQEDNPPVPYEEVKRVIESELNGNIDELFSEFSKESLATASIAQVHEARLITGERVAVKVQKEGINENLEQDLAIMKSLANTVHKYSDEFRKYNLPEMIKEFDHSIHIELDYTNELINMNVLGANFEEDETIHIPIAYADYCTPKVLTMEFIDGTNLQDVYVSDSEEFDKELIAKRVIDSFMKQVLIDGFFHGDPHAGNIIILEDNVVCYIDLGAMGILDDDFRKKLTDMLMLVADQDINGLINQFIYMGIIDYSMDTTDLKRDLRDLFLRMFASDSTGFNDIFDQMLGLMQDHGIILPTEFVSMARGISMIESVSTTLDPKIDMIASIEPIAKESVKERVNIKNFIESKKGSLLYYKNMLTSLLPLIAKAIHKIDNGDMKVKFELDGLDRIVSKFSLVVIIAALLISSSLVMTITRGPMLFDMPLIAVIGYVITLILSIIGIINYLYGR